MSQFVSSLVGHKCVHLVNGVCDVASRLGNKRIQPDIRACIACEKQPNPFNINRVTVSLAVTFGLSEGRETLIREHAKLLSTIRIEDYTARLRKLVDGAGVGSQLWRLLEKLGIRHTQNCPCLAWAERMNDWGPKGCRLARQEIVTHMKMSATNYGWGDMGTAVAKAITSGLAFRLSILDPYGSLLDEAIRLAEISERTVSTGQESFRSSSKPIPDCR